MAYENVQHNILPSEFSYSLHRHNSSGKLTFSNNIVF